MRILVLLLLVAPAAFAQSITGLTGTVADGGQLTILGGSFGTKNAPAPYLYSDFNEGVAETAVDSLEHVHGWYSWGAGDDDPARYSDEAVRDFDGLNARFIYPDRITGSGLSDDLIQEDIDVNAGDKIYMSMYIWSTFDGCRVDGNDPQQWKIFRLSHGQNGYPALIFLWHGAGLTPPGTSKLANYQGTGGENEARYLPGETPPDTATWWHFEMQVQVNSAPGVENGSVVSWYNGEEKLARDDWAWLGSGDSANDAWNWIMIGQYIQRPPHVTVVRYDDIYFDKSWARVILADTDNYATNTHREVQIPTSWDENSVSVTVNTGTFRPGQTAYLYVIDPNGNPIGPREVVIDGEIIDEGEPGQPSPVEMEQVP